MKVNLLPPPAGRRECPIEEVYENWNRGCADHDIHIRAYGVGMRRGGGGHTSGPVKLTGTYHHYAASVNDS
jgi:hypothetical protein